MTVIEHMEGKGTKFTEDHPLYVLMEKLLSEEQIDVLLAMDMRVLISVEDLSAKCGKPVDEVQRILDDMRMIGVVEDKIRDGKRLWEFKLVIPGMAENVVLNKTQFAEHSQDIAKMFRAVSTMPPTLVPMIPQGGAGLAMHVIPIEKAIPAGTKTVNHDQISYWLKKYEWISVQDCQCRTVQKELGEWCGHSIKDRCFYVGEAARNIIETGRGRRVTYEEAMKILEEGEAEGCMHQCSNLDGEDEIFTICNCCVCGCHSLKNSVYNQTPNANRSNFVAKIDPEKCAACGECVEYCPANAITMTERFCQKVKAPEPELREITMDEYLTGKYFNPNYRKERTYVNPDTGTAPCRGECPAHIAVQGYIRLAALGKYREALELIKNENPFPAICGSVCPHKCENECTRGTCDQAVSIDEIKKFIAHQELNDKNRFVPRKLRDNRDIHIAVVGSGPAGLSCAYYLAVLGYSVTVFEKEKVLGGMMSLGIPSFRLEKDVVQAEIDILKELGVEFKTGIEVGRDITIRFLRYHGYKAIYLAIGAQKGRALGVEGEDADGVIAGVDFLRDINLGKEIKFKGNVVVVGGGNVAIDVARTAVRVTDGTVGMYCLESRETMPALPEEQEEAEEEGIGINNGWGPKRIVTENGKVTGVEFKKCLSTIDETGRFNPKYDENDTILVPADTVLLSIGQSIDWGKLLEHTEVKTGRGGVAIANSRTYQTDDPDIFVGGDVYTGPKFAINAIAAGKLAANYISHYVQPGQDMETGLWVRDFKAIDKDNAIIGDYDSTPRQRVSHDPSKLKSFRDSRKVLTEEEVKKEAGRCLKCGVSEVNQNKCIGCGLCTTKCKFDAISISKVYDNDFGVMNEECFGALEPNFKLILKGDHEIIRESVEK
jgi:NADPH-dependent glutamate synthase beta subunit-like oxidoreductase